MAKATGAGGISVETECGFAAGDAGGFTREAETGLTASDVSSLLRSIGMSTDATESLRVFLTQQLKDVEADIETISDYICCNPPDTSGELLKLRELQRKYCCVRSLRASGTKSTNWVSAGAR